MFSHVIMLNLKCDWLEREQNAELARTKKAFKCHQALLLMRGRGWAWEYRGGMAGDTTDNTQRFAPYIASTSSGNHNPLLSSSQLTIMKYLKILLDSVNIRGIFPERIHFIFLRSKLLVYKLKVKGSIYLWKSGNSSMVSTCTCISPLSEEVRKSRWETMENNLAPACGQGLHTYWN